MQCVDFGDVEPQLLDADAEVLAAHDTFEVRKWKLDATRLAKPEGAFAIIVCVSGPVNCGGLQLTAGQFCLVPASLSDCVIKSATDEAVVLQVTVPRAN
jgi:mannose-6-phosphate isomerase class I